MSVVIENPETGEERVLEKLSTGHYPNFKLPWRLKGAAMKPAKFATAQEVIVKEKIREVKKARTIDMNVKLDKIAAALFIPAADVAKVVGKALGIDCPYCQLRFMIWKKAEEIGWWKVIYLTAKSIKAQLRHDKRALEQMAKELENSDG